MPTYQPGTATPGYGQPQPGYYQPTYPPIAPGGGGKSGSTAVLWVLIAVFAVLLCGGAGVAGVIVYRNSDDTSTAQPNTPGPPSQGPTSEATDPPSNSGPRRITYQVTGDGPASISYIKDSKSGSQRLSSASLPWQVEVSAPENLFMVSLIAMRKGTGEGTISCRVLVDGKEVISNTRTGSVAMVTCLKVIPD